MTDSLHQPTEAETPRNPYEGLCLPWLWPFFTFASRAGEQQQSIDDPSPACGFTLPTDILKFMRETHKLDYELHPIWVTLNTTKLDLSTMLLRKFARKTAQNFPVIIDAPYAGHSATITDFAPDQSLVRTLHQHGLGTVYVTDWKSATPAMQDFSIDTYLQDLDAAVDAVGGKAHLLGICQGGWLSAAYAARFPGKVCSLVLAGAPIDADAGDGVVKQLAHTLPMSLYLELVSLGGGRLLGKIMLASWKNLNPTAQYVKKYRDLFTNIRNQTYLNRAEEFARWYETPLDLPGVYYLQAVSWIFKENRLAKGALVALGQTISLKDITIPVYLLAGEDDEITPAAQVFNAAQYLGTPAAALVQKLVPGGHIGLFMVRRTLGATWPEICQWLLSCDAKA